MTSRPVQEIFFRHVYIPAQQQLRGLVYIHLALLIDQRTGQHLDPLLLLPIGTRLWHALKDHSGLVLLNFCAPEKQRINATCGN